MRRSWILSKCQVESIVHLYGLGENLQKLSSQFGVTPDAISGMLRRRGVKIRNNRVSLSEDDKLLLIDMYGKSKGTVEIAKRFGVSQAWVWRYVSAVVGRTRSRQEASTLCRKYVFDESFFENIDCPDKAYVLGFVFADGCNRGDGLTISLAKKDREHLVGIARMISYDGPITDKIQKLNSKEHCVSSLTVCSKKMSADLTRQGGGIRKTFRLNIPRINDSLLCHFVRGYFDGDGCMYVYPNKNAATSSIAGCHGFICELRDLLLRVGIEHVFVNKKTSRLAYVSVSHTEGIKQLYDFLYSDGGICLERKRDKFVRFFRLKGLKIEKECECVDKHQEKDTKDV